MKAKVRIWQINPYLAPIDKAATHTHSPPSVKSKETDVGNKSRTCFVTESVKMSLKSSLCS